MPSLPGIHFFPPTCQLGTIWAWEETYLPSWGGGWGRGPWLDLLLLFLAAFCCRMTGPFPAYLGLVTPEKWLFHLVFWGLCLIPPMVLAVGLWRWRPCTPWPSCSNSRPLHNLWPLSTMVSSHWSIWKLPDSMCIKCRPWEVRSSTLKAPKQHPQPGWPVWQWYHVAEVSYKCRLLEGGVLGLILSLYIHRKAESESHCSGELLVWAAWVGRHILNWLFLCFLVFSISSSS